MPELKEVEESQSRSCLGVRYVQFFLMFCSLIVFFGQRTTLSVAIIAMTAKNPPSSDIPTFPQWDNTDTILSSFFWGYLLTQTIAGQLGERYGPKWFLVGTMLSGSVFNGLVPIMAVNFGSTGVMICRFCHGLSQGFLFSCFHLIISNWAPFSERTRTTSIIHSGSPLGIVASMILSGIISDSQLGWPYVFYFYAAAGVIITILFCIFVANSPSEHKTISEGERKYIEASTSVQIKKKISTPWKSILTSLPVWALFVSFCCQAWGNFTLLTEIPSFLSNVMSYDLQSSGELSSLPYVAQFFSNFIAAPMADYLIGRRIFSVSTARKVFNSIGNMVPAFALFALSFIDRSQKNLALVLLIIAVGAAAFTNSGSLVNIVDLSPNYAGTVLGLTNGTSQIFSILGPMSVGFLGTDKTDLMLWRKVFWLASGIYMVCSTFFIVFSSGELQPWNDFEESKENKEKV